ncbi:hypothetical protein KRX11_01005 [Pasteurellaceae bacterium TAE3-ERU1]|nr:hypothetical protein [Pasteurellaceae bacterium TAE3-ERU1]
MNTKKPISIPPRRWYSLEHAAEKLTRESEQPITSRDLVHYWLSCKLEISIPAYFDLLTLDIGDQRLNANENEISFFDKLHESAELMENIRKSNDIVIIKCLADVNQIIDEGFDLDQDEKHIVEVCNAINFKSENTICFIKGLMNIIIDFNFESNFLQKMIF